MINRERKRISIFSSLVDQSRQSMTSRLTRKMRVKRGSERKQNNLELILTKSFVLAVQVRGGIEAEKMKRELRRNTDG